MQLRRLIVAVAAIACGALGGAAPSFAEPAWAPADSATIRPGNQTITEGGQCTSNFVFYDAADNVYVGQAAHCSGTGGATETNGCDSGSLPIGTHGRDRERRRQPGTMVYNSWIAMQAAGETDADACAFNDFALVRVRSRRRREGEPVDPVLGRTDRHRPTSSPAREGLHLRQLVAACRRRPAEARRGREIGTEPGRLELPASTP